MLSYIKNFPSQKNREFFVLTFLFSLVFFSILSLIVDKSFFPFVKFKMFDNVVKEPISTVFYISSVDVNNNETMIRKKLMGPMTLRQVAGLLNLGDETVKKSATGLLLSRARESFGDIRKFRLYEYKCDCFNYYEQPHTSEYLDYINTKCTKKMLMEKNYE